MNKGGDRFPDQKSIRHRLKNLANRLILSIWEIEDIAAMPKWAGKLYKAVTGRMCRYKLPPFPDISPVKSKEIFILNGVWVCRTFYGDPAVFPGDIRGVMMTDRSGGP